MRITKLPKNYVPNKKALEPLIDTSAEEKRIQSIKEQEEIHKTEKLRQKLVSQEYSELFKGKDKE